MGDHRAECWVKFVFHGKTYEWQSGWANWNDGESHIQEVTRFLEESTEDGLGRYNAEVAEAEWKASAAERERQERAEYERLKAKFEKA